MRFLLTPRWIWFFVAVAVLAVVCVRLGEWQWDKREARHDSNVLVERHLAQDPQPLETVVPAGETVAADQEWTRVTATGSYDPSAQVTVKFITRDGRPGADVVTPLRLEDGSAILVDRGWLQTDNTGEPPSDVPAPPSGEVSVEGWLRLDNGAGREATVPSERQVRAISSTGLGETVSYPLRSGYLNLRDQTGGTGDLELEPAPDLGGGPHFFYGLQWWFFAALALIGFIWFARLEYLDRRRGTGAYAPSQATPQAPRQASETSSR